MASSNLLLTAKPAWFLSTLIPENVGLFPRSVNSRCLYKDLISLLDSRASEYLTVDGNEGDRNNLALWHQGDTLIQTVAGSCENTVVVMHTVGQVIMEPWIDMPNVKAVLWAGLPGQESGNSIRDILFGMVNPSGRLPFTIARQRSDYSADVVGYDLPDDTQELSIPYSEGLLIDCQ